MSARLEAVAAVVRDGDERRTANLVKEALAEGFGPSVILAKGLIPGLQQLGELFKDGQAFLPEILISVRAFRAGLQELPPELRDNIDTQKGTVILGSVEGDLHDIGRNLVGMMLAGNGFHVVDLGGDVSAETFVGAAREHEADIVALSSLLTTTLPAFGRVIQSLEVAGLRERVRVMVGGAPVSRALANEIGAEGFAEDCIAAVEEAERLVAGKVHV